MNRKTKQITYISIIIVVLLALIVLISVCVFYKKTSNLLSINNSLNKNKLEAKIYIQEEFIKNDAEKPTIKVSQTDEKSILQQRSDTKKQDTDLSKKIPVKSSDENNNNTKTKSNSHINDTFQYDKKNNTSDINSQELKQNQQQQKDKKYKHLKKNSKNQLTKIIEETREDTAIDDNNNIERTHIYQVKEKIDHNGSGKSLKTFKAKTDDIEFTHLIVDEFGNTSLHEAAKNNDVKTGLLFVNSIEKYYVYEKIKNTDKFLNYLNEYLLENKVHIDKINEKERYEVYEKFLKSHTNRQDGLYISPLSSLKNENEFFQYSAKYINKKNDHGESAIHVAITNGNINFLNFLINNEANLDIKDAQGNTPIQLAMKMRKKNIYDILRNKQNSNNCC